jgi:hypothetical protein
MKKAILRFVAMGILAGGLAAASPESLFVAEKSVNGPVKLTFNPPGDPTPRVSVCKGDGC